MTVRKEYADSVEFSFDHRDDSRVAYVDEIIAAVHDSELARIFTAAANMGAAPCVIDRTPIRGGSNIVVVIGFDTAQEAEFNALTLADRGYYETFADYADACMRCKRGAEAARLELARMRSIFRV